MLNVPPSAHQSRGLTSIDWSSVLSEQVPILIQRALDEDAGEPNSASSMSQQGRDGAPRTGSASSGASRTGDVTTLATIPADLHQSGIMLAKAPGVVAGLRVAQQTFLQVDPTVEFTPLVEDGAHVSPGTHIAKVAGPARALLTGERVALNFLQRMSGIATATKRYVDAVAGAPGAPRARILDTRKTVPGLRLLDKWAVVLGGGYNHRIGLYDMAMIKDNHIAAAGGITAAVERVRQRWGTQLPVEVEVSNLEQLREALALDVDQIMLDNMGLAEMSAAVKLVDGRVPLEASGNVSLETVAAIAATGVDYISVGKLTHSVEALDISFKL